MTCVSLEELDRTDLGEFDKPLGRRLVLTAYQRYLDLGQFDVSFLISRLDQFFDPEGVVIRRVCSLLT